MNVICAMLVALVGAGFTGYQTALLLLEKEAICFNDGCTVVEALTKVSPLVMNAFGFIFFMLVILTLYKSRRNGGQWPLIASMLLTGAMAAEGALVAFQHFIAGVFCSYCLIICGIVFLANLCCGVKHFARSLAAFLGVAVAFSILQFSAKVPTQGDPLTQGTYGSVAGHSNNGEMFFFFSETCPHCEEVIEELKQENTCEIQFNPVSPLSAAPFTEMSLNESYNPESNISYLNGLGINEIPVLLVRGESEINIYKGKRTIANYLQAHCMEPRTKQDAELSNDGQSSVSTEGGLDYLLPSPSAEAEDENCEMTNNTDC